MSRIGEIDDASGMCPLAEKQMAKIRRGKFRGMVGRVTHLRRGEHPRVCLRIDAVHEVWLDPRSVEVVF
jgi:hypothetical protein